MIDKRTVDPRVARLRSRLALGIRYGHDDVDETRRELEIAKAEATIRRIVESAPPLTPSDAARIRALLPPVRKRGAAA